MNKFEHVQGGRFVVRFKVQSEQVEHILGIHDWVQGCMMDPYVGRTAQDQAVPHDLSLTNKSQAVVTRGPLGAGQQRQS